MNRIYFIGQMTYIYVQIPSGNGQKLYKIDLKKWTIQNIVLPSPRKVDPNLIYVG